MERLQAYKFQLRPQAGQESLMRQFAGCCRFLWNKTLVLEAALNILAAGHAVSACGAGKNSSARVEAGTSL